MTRFGLTLAATALLACALVWAQGTGAIVGTVTDPSGGVIPNANVKATNVATALTREAATNSQGYYVIPSLHPATYTLSVTAPGFREYTQRGVVLLADQSATVNVALAVGQQSQTVTVESGGVQVDTTTATLKGVVDQTRMIELPLNGRNAAELSLLVAGAVSAPSAGANQGLTKTPPGAVTISTNGSFSNEVSYMLDGGNNTDSFTQINLPFPFPDALQEFSVLTSNYRAQYGENTGGVVDVITRSGGNAVHGDVFGFVRNAVFNARNFFEANRDQLKRAQAGGTIGGPITIPSLYSGRDRTFFFFGYQETRIRNLTGTSSAFVPTADELNGDFSALLDAANPANPQGKVTRIVDPTTGQPFPGNRIPVSRFDPAALNVVKVLPHPAGTGQVFYNRRIAQDTHELVSRGDHSFRPADQLSFRWYANYFNNAGTLDPANILTYADGSNIPSQNYLLHYTHIFSPALLNNFRFDYARTNAQRTSPPGAPNVRDFGVQNFYQPPTKSIESISASGFFSFGDVAGGARFVRNDFEWSDDLSWVRGRHNFAFGARIQRSRQDITNVNTQNGSFSFTSDVTNYALASFLLGKMRSFIQGMGQFENSRNTYLGFYAQDTFKALSRLTLDFGVRYEPFLPWHEIFGRTKQFRSDAFYAGRRSQVFANAPPGMFFPGDPGTPPDGTTSDLNNLAPRAGFAWDVLGTGKTGVRGGAGVFYEARQSSFVHQKLASTTPFAPRLTFNDPQGPFSNPYLGITNPFPIPLPPPHDVAFTAPVEIYSLDPSSKFVSPIAYNWNLTIEQQLAPNWLARAAYVGAHGSHLREGINLNPAFFIAGSRLGTDQRRLLFPGLGSVYLDSQDINSSYHSLQLTLERRLAKGLTLLANYTFSKSLDDLPFPAEVSDNAMTTNSALPWFDPGRHRFDYGRSDTDRAHRFVASYVWQLPALHGAAPLARRLLGDWQVTGILTMQSGGPLTILAGSDRSQTGIGRDRGVITGAAFGSGACNNRAPCVDYLNAGSFQLPAPGAFGDAGKGSVGGPALFNWDMGFFKNVPFGERWRVQLRGEFFNIFNRVNLGAPVTSVSSAGFGSIRSAGDPRIGQLALKVFF